MAEKIRIDVVTPDALLYSEEAAMVVVPGSEGDFGVLVNHAPIISTVRPGLVKIYNQNGGIAKSIFVAGGFAEVTGERCTILAEEAVETSKLKSKEARARLKAANENFNKAQTQEEKDAAQQQIAAAEVMVSVFQDS